MHTGDALGVLGLPGLVGGDGPDGTFAGAFAALEAALAVGRGVERDAAVALIGPVPGYRGLGEVVRGELIAHGAREGGHRLAVGLVGAAGGYLRRHGVPRYEGPGGYHPEAPGLRPVGELDERVVVRAQAVYGEHHGGGALGADGVQEAREDLRYPPAEDRRGYDREVMLAEGRGLGPGGEVEIARLAGDAAGHAPRDGAGAPARGEVERGDRIYFHIVHPLFGLATFYHDAASYTSAARCIALPGVVK